MLSGTYIGPEYPELQGKTALIKLLEDDRLEAQFDDLSVKFSFGWKIFKRSDFKIETGMYLYIFEDGQQWMTQRPPNLEELISCEQGVLNIYSQVGGRFVECTYDGETGVNYHDIEVKE